LLIPLDLDATLIHHCGDRGDLHWHLFSEFCSSLRLPILTYPKNFREGADSPTIIARLYLELIKFCFVKTSLKLVKWLRSCRYFFKIGGGHFPIDYVPGIQISNLPPLEEGGASNKLNAEAFNLLVTLMSLYLGVTFLRRYIPAFTVLGGDSH